MSFRYEHLEVWPLALEYVDACFVVADGLPQRVQFSIGEQLRRAATSLVANIAEGSGKATASSERNFYDIARGSLAETVGLLALCHRRRYLDDDKHGRMYNRANLISSMLWGLIKHHSSRALGEPEPTYELAAFASGSHDLASIFAASSDSQPSPLHSPPNEIPSYVRHCHCRRPMGRRR